MLQRTVDGTNYFVISKFIDNAVTLKSILRANHIYEEDRDLSVISLEPHKDLPLKTKAKIEKDTILEYLKLTPDLERKMQRKDFTVGNALVEGRIALKIILYILGEIDELHNRDGNVLLKASKYHIDDVNKIITPEVIMMGIDLGLCLKLSESQEGMFEKSFNFAAKKKDSLKMGLELNGNPATNLKPTKDTCLLTFIPIYESNRIHQYLDAASEHLDREDMEFVEAAKTRFTICYLAAKCIESGLDKPENKADALRFMAELMTEQQEHQVPQANNCISL